MTTAIEEQKTYAKKSSQYLAESFPILSICGINVSLKESRIFSNTYAGKKGSIFTVVPNVFRGVRGDRDAILFSITNQKGKKVGNFCVSNGCLVECERA